MDRPVSTVTRTVTVSDLTPVEMASIFAAYDARQQAAFFSALFDEARDWPNSGWCGQAHYVVSKLDDKGRTVVSKLDDKGRTVVAALSEHYVASLSK